MTTEIVEWRGDLRGILSVAIKERIDRAYARDPEPFSMDGDTLASKFKERKYVPTATDNLLRMNFWRLVNRVHAGVEQAIDYSEIFKGISTRSSFDLKMENPMFVAFLLTPLILPQVRSQEALGVGIERIREILAVSPVVHMEKGAGIDTKLAAIQVKIVEMLDRQLNGEAVQRHLNINVETGGMATSREMVQQDAKQLGVNTETYEEIREKLRELEAKSGLSINDQRRYESARLPAKTEVIQDVGPSDKSDGRGEHQAIDISERGSIGWVRHLPLGDAEG